MESLNDTMYVGETKREREQNTQNLDSKIITLCTLNALRERFYTSPYELTEVLT